MAEHSSRADEWVALATEKYFLMVYRLAYARTHSRQDAEDITQDVMMKLIAHAAGIESEDHLRAWLLRVTVNQSISLFRSAWRRLTLPLNEQVLHEETTAEYSELDEALRTLNEKMRVAVHLFYFERMSVNEIADVLNISADAVKTRLHRARKKLKIELMAERGTDDVCK